MFRAWEEDEDILEGIRRQLQALEDEGMEKMMMIGSPSFSPVSSPSPRSPPPPQLLPVPPADWMEIEEPSLLFDSWLMDLSMEAQPSTPLCASSPLYRGSPPPAPDSPEHRLAYDAQMNLFAEVPRNGEIDVLDNEPVMMEDSSPEWIYDPAQMGYAVVPASEIQHGELNPPSPAARERTITVDSSSEEEVEEIIIDSSPELEVVFESSSPKKRSRIDAIRRRLF